LIRGEGIFRSKEYLGKICLINISDTPEWNDIIHINKIRNVFVHNLGRLDDANKHMQYINQKKQYLKLDAHNRIVIGQGYLEEICSVFHKCLFDTIEKVLA
jgi:hypothetical protein